MAKVGTTSCGGDGTDILTGGDGVDLACAVDDHVTLTVGEMVMFELSANDEVLNDEASETHSASTIRTISTIS